MINSTVKTGKRGRPATGRKSVEIRLTPEEQEALRSLGGSAFLQNLLNEIRAGRQTFRLDTTRLSEDQRDQFIEGWEKAGGFTDDCDAGSPEPWCCPWDYNAIIEVTGCTPQQWGAVYWRTVKDEAEAVRLEDQKYRQQEQEEKEEEEKALELQLRRFLGQQ